MKKTNLFVAAFFAASVSFLPLSIAEEASSARDQMLLADSDYGSGKSGNLLASAYDRDESHPSTRGRGKKYGHDKDKHPRGKHGKANKDQDAGSYGAKSGYEKDQKTYGKDTDQKSYDKDAKTSGSDYGTGKSEYNKDQYGKDKDYKSHDAGTYDKDKKSGSGKDTDYKYRERHEEKNGETKSEYREERK
jgi:hypothetical protein